MNYWDHKKKKTINKSYMIEDKYETHKAISFWKPNYATPSSHFTQISIELQQRTTTDYASLKAELQCKHAHLPTNLYAHLYKLLRKKDR